MVVIEAAILLFRAFKPLLIAKKIDTNHRLGMGALGTIIMIAGSGLLETWLGLNYLQDRLPLGAGGFWGQTIVPLLEYGVGRSSGVIISMLLMLIFSKIKSTTLKAKIVFNKLKITPANLFIQPKKAKSANLVRIFALK